MRRSSANKFITSSIHARLQKEGDPAGSTTAYLAALDMHASLARVTPKYGPEYHLAPIAVMIEIFSNLPLATIVHLLTRVSKGWCALARNPGLWKVRFIA